MNLKRQLRETLRRKKEENKKADIEYKQSLIRSDEDWKKINDFLSKVIMEEAERTGNRWIELSCMFGDIGYFSQKDIILSDNKSLTINHQDIKRFCKQHHFKLRFKNLESVSLNETETFKALWYHDILTCAYLIRV